MSRISYCSLEEAWGDSFNRKDRNEYNNEYNNEQNKNKNNNNDKIYSRNKYDKLIEDSQDERNNVIANMNNIERKKIPENNSIVEYNKYRFNQNNNVKNNSYDEEYTPFKESIEKKYLQDKINYLENEFLKYKHMIEEKTPTDNTNYNEHFSNNDTNYSNNNNNYSNNNDLFDLIILIIIGLLVIFVLNSIFNIGKAIGARQKI